MISQKFSILSEDHIISFMTESEPQQENDILIDSIESTSDLWTLAKMEENYNEENDIHIRLTDNDPDVFSLL